jgi:TetR/AcrR family transcriptional regulator
VKRTPAARRPAARKPAEAQAGGTREVLLRAARQAFAERGFEGARVDDIAGRAGANKQLVYHYFGSKDALYVAVLEDVYRDIRDQEQALDLGQLQPVEAMRRLIEFSFDYLAEHREFVSIVADENTHGGRHVESSGRLAPMNRPIIDLIRKTLARGVADGSFRAGLDPLHLYLSIAGMSYFYFANMHTLSRVFARSLGTRRALAERRRHIVDFTLHALANPASRGRA